ncbi:hypothetical protein PHYBLDRAFT_186010 [Phycomyces blakesleeanus NRRL 1555(-)]|uniref:Uncharacterized protein n=1 Tax=Phycomyces blakesleeanus (strain ATCC 8743b / DSM 1359 / FGSC 10004 / NBRC 33097 / NRRL 1555) TaxID=763407 RepID=A0A162XN00_PHYB8|nr:hypothetical protein PHYBLDRAFT_186010 [Phycomyces blakesleeanus NRRL 1555(-)]OAD75765.1 hypothetical protein PHYBLDRAFT_186010 [Phycomyces blakesleeanus NRRL 1555(-)]|eukprot:XP_018293805.1 hypothetical protein PHYBLDRAFT_186010 [Phycomyces blakesleeanus NRRL 1555(-)]
MSKFLSANQDDDYTEFSFLSNNISISVFTVLNIKNIYKRPVSNFKIFYPKTSTLIGCLSILISVINTFKVEPSKIILLWWLKFKKFLRGRIEDLKLGTKIRENLCSPNEVLTSKVNVFMSYNYAYNNPLMYPILW